MEEETMKRLNDSYYFAAPVSTVTDLPNPPPEAQNYETVFCWVQSEEWLLYKWTHETPQWTEMVPPERKRDKLLKQLKDLQQHKDREFAHGEADCLLLELIDDEEITEAFNLIEKWYA
jgi:hypothetical protein